MPDGLGRDAAKRHMLMRHRGPGDFARSAAQRSSTALPRPVVALYDQRCTERGISIMANVQVTLSLPVLRRGSNPESGPTVIEHLQLMLNERGGFPIQRMRPRARLLRRGATQRPTFARPRSCQLAAARTATMSDLRRSSLGDVPLLVAIYLGLR